MSLTCKDFFEEIFEDFILVNTRTPLHDHARKNKGWSDTQVVFRFIIMQIVAAMIGYIIISLL